MIPGSVAELGDDGRVYNTEVVLDPNGKLVASYRKVFPWQPYEAWSSGHEFIVFDMPGIGRKGGRTRRLIGMYTDELRRVGQSWAFAARRYEVLVDHGVDPGKA